MSLRRSERRNIVSSRTTAVGSYRQAESQLFAGFGERIGLSVYFVKGSVGNVGAV
jgi:hypothetical protein